MLDCQCSISETVVDTQNASDFESTMPAFVKREIKPIANDTEENGLFYPILFS